MASGSLTIVGTGIQISLHLTPEARAELEHADEVLFLAIDAVASRWLEGVNPNSRSLATLYEDGKDRRETYTEMVEEILKSVRQGRRVCVAFYGHPGVFVQPSHEAIRRARLEGFEARMLAAVSAEDCLFADVGVDPGRTGCQTYEASDFLMHRRAIDTTAALILWQVGFLGQVTYSARPDSSRVPVLVEYLLESYPPDHEIVVYEASPYPVRRPSIQRLPLSDLASAELGPMSTLYVPRCAPPTPDHTMLERLGLISSGATGDRP